MRVKGHATRKVSALTACAESLHTYKCTYIIYTPIAHINLQGHTKLDPMIKLRYTIEMPSKAGQDLHQPLSASPTHDELNVRRRGKPSTFLDSFSELQGYLQH
jgi:hypothetical protein